MKMLERLSYIKVYFRWIKRSWVIFLLVVVSLITSSILHGSAVNSASESYSVSIELDVETRRFLKQGSYSLYVFKGINAGLGAQSTVWLKLTGNRELYHQNQVQISWEQQYYIGETLTKAQDGAILPPGTDVYKLKDSDIAYRVPPSISVSDIPAIELENASRYQKFTTVYGLSPYISTSDIRAIFFGKAYRYEGLNWNRNPGKSTNPATAEIVNVPKSINYFYVAQPVKDNLGYYDYICVLGLPGNGSVGSLQISENIALLFSNQSLQEGEVVLKAPAKGLIVATESGKTISISYNKNTGWDSPKGSTRSLEVGASIYSELK